jgi:hypothetical protein
MAGVEAGERPGAGWRGALLAAVGVAGAVALLWWATLAEGDVACRVCTQHMGRVHCSRVAAATREKAQAAALQSACGALAGGVTSGLACQRQPPLSVDCDDPGAIIPDQSSPISRETP